MEMLDDMPNSAVDLQIKEKVRLVGGFVSVVADSGFLFRVSVDTEAATPGADH